MKKTISIILSVLLTIGCFLPCTVFAAESSTADEEKYIYTTYQGEDYAEIEGVSVYSSNLISKSRISISKSGTTLNITGITKGTDEVVKCGFTKVIVQRRASSSSSWSKYKTFKDLYSNSNYYTLTKSVTVEKGYQYRVVATHYAKKSLFSTQKIESTSSYISF